MKKSDDESSGIRGDGRDMSIITTGRLPTPPLDQLETMIDECSEIEDMSPYVWHRMEVLTEYMEDHGHDVRSFLSLITGDFNIDDDWFQTDVCGHLISCTDDAYTLLLTTDSSIIESIWMSCHGMTG